MPDNRSFHSIIICNLFHLLTAGIISVQRFGRMQSRKQMKSKQSPYECKCINVVFVNNLRRIDWNNKFLYMNGIERENDLLIEDCICFAQCTESTENCSHEFIIHFYDINATVFANVGSFAGFHFIALWFLMWVKSIVTC